MTPIPLTLLLLIPLLSLTTLLVHSTPLEPSKPHSTVQELTSDTFETALSDTANGCWLLMFYAPSCQHCQKMSNTLNRMSNYLSGTMSLGKINCKAETSLCDSHNIKRFPTLMVSRDGEFFPYPGKRDADSIIEFGERMSQQVVVLVHSYDDAMEHVSQKNENGVGFVVYDGTATSMTDEESDMSELLVSTTTLQVFGQVARKMQAYDNFGVLRPDTSQEELVKFGVTTSNPTIMKIEHNTPTVLYNGDMSTPQLLEFVKENNLPLISNFDSHNFHSLGLRGKPMVIVVVDPESIDITTRILEELKEYVTNGPKHIVNQYLFGQINGRKWKKFLKSLNVNENYLPDVVVLDLETNIYWKDESFFQLGEFITAVAEGTVVGQSMNMSGGGGLLDKISEIISISLLRTVGGILIVISIIVFILRNHLGGGFTNVSTIYSGTTKEEIKKKN